MDKTMPLDKIAGHGRDQRPVPKHQRLCEGQPMSEKDSKRIVRTYKFRLFVNANQERELAAKSRRHLSDRQVDSICERYIAGAQKRTLADEYGVSLRVIRRAVVSRGIAMRSHGLERRTKTVRDDAFAEFTPEAAYWIGFLFADGCIQHNPASLAISLAKKDAEHLEALRQFLGSNHSVGIDRKSQMRFTVRSEKIVSDLAAFGVVPRKTFAAYPHECCIQSRDFWRGVIDGDGWTGRYKYRTKLMPSIGLVGASDLVNLFASAASAVCGRRFNVRLRGNLRIVTVTGTQADVIGHWLYDSAAICLPRKNLWKTGSEQ